MNTIGHLSDNSKLAVLNRQSKIGNRKWMGLSIIALVLVVQGVRVDAQQSPKTPLIGYLEGGPQSAHTARMEAFRQGLRERGYEEGKNIAIEWRFGDGKVERLPGLAAELLHLKVALIVTGGGTPTRAAKEATSTVPIVMAQHNDPVGSGIVVSLSHPGGNITGLSTLTPELSGKRLEILREVVPKLTRVAVFGNTTNKVYAEVMREIETAANAFGMKLQFINILDAKDVEAGFRAATKASAQAILTAPSVVLVAERAQVVALAAKKSVTGELQQ
jgi:putative tryptophan/tyrosine transport system substrate-binding protein